MASPVEKIAQLNDIDQDVAQLLHSAGLAIKTLTSSTLGTGENSEALDQDIGQRKDRFSAASSQYFSLLSSIDVRLRRQISALETAQIIASEASTKETQSNPDAATPLMRMLGGSPSHSLGSSKDPTTNGGLGNLDVSWLNSRNNKVEKDMQAELWEGAHKLVQKTVEDKVVKDDSGDITMSSESTASLE
ncbi:MAG: hypothetical protein LQ352_000457 [Teloschistes flavicans]|nr:MAG: hypothetical protein LQ352_000457 [Teloschistes flavicans]